MINERPCADCGTPMGVHPQTRMHCIGVLHTQVDALKASLKRLASMEAFTVGRVVRHPEDDETIARIEYARQALGGEDKWQEA